jgi:NapH/MauN family ferredoxin-type protein
MKPEVQRTSSAPLFRAIALAAVWALMTLITILHQYRGGGPHGVPTVDALCPMGGLATLYKVLADGEYLQRVFPSAIILLGATLLVAFIFRRAFCGWICPLGAMQDFFAAIGRRTGWHRSLVGNKLDGALRSLKYVVLVLILALTYYSGELVFRHYDPWASYAHVSAGWGELTDEFLVGSILLVLLLVGSLVVERPYCRYLCPFGAFLGAVSRYGLVRVVRNDHTCTHCRRCDNVCPVDIPVEAMSQVTTGECVSCGKCINACPIPSALNLEAYRARLRPSFAGLIALAIFFGVVLLTKVSGGSAHQGQRRIEVAACYHV